jgi:NADPH:quinone reductase-like Zn-dependent oxidoreductase
MPSVTPFIPLTQTAIVCVGKGKLAVSHDVPVPKLKPDMVIVQTTAVALNPVDAKMVDYSPAVGAIDGYDYAGEIAAVGSSVTHLAVGDRVCGMVHGMNTVAPGIGAFAQYVAAPAEFVIKVPSYMSDEKAASLGTGVATVGLALFHSLKIPASPTKPLSGDDSFFVLVYGASTATGTMALQILRL